MTTNDAGGGGASSEVPPLALTCRRMGNKENSCHGACGSRGHLLTTELSSLGHRRTFLFGQCQLTLAQSACLETPTFVTDINMGFII